MSDDNSGEHNQPQQPAIEKKPTATTGSEPREYTVDKTGNVKYKGSSEDEIEKRWDSHK